MFTLSLMLITINFCSYASGITELWCFNPCLVQNEANIEIPTELVWGCGVFSFLLLYLDIFGHLPHFFEEILSWIFNFFFLLKSLPRKLKVIKWKIFRFARRLKVREVRVLCPLYRENFEGNEQICTALFFSHLIFRHCYLSLFSSHFFFLKLYK